MGVSLAFAGDRCWGSRPGIPRQFDANHETWQQFHRETRTTMNCKICTYCILTKKREQKWTKKPLNLRTMAADVWKSDTALLFFLNEASSHDTVIIWQSRRNHRSQKPTICFSFVLRFFLSLFFWGRGWFVVGFFFSPCRRENERLKLP